MLEPAVPWSGPVTVTVTVKSIFWGRFLEA